MVLVAVDDLMFGSKIRAAASQLGTAIAFARTPAGLLDQARAGGSGLILMDLNSRTLAPLTTLASLRGDPALAGWRVVAFVSHVETELIQAARQAGADEVLARSAFSQRLPDLLRGAAPASGQPPS